MFAIKVSRISADLYWQLRFAVGELGPFAPYMAEFERVVDEEDGDAATESLRRLAEDATDLMRQCGPVGEDMVWLQHVVQPDEDLMYAPFISSNAAHVCITHFGHFVVRASVVGLHDVYGGCSGRRLFPCRIECYRRRWSLEDTRDPVSHVSYYMLPSDLVGAFAGALEDAVAEAWREIIVSH